MRPDECQYYRLWSKRPSHRVRIADAERLIATRRDYAVSVSWGKDSIAALAIAARAVPDIVAIHGRYRHKAERLADLDAVRDAVLARPECRLVRYTEVEVPGEWDVFERVGHAFRSPSTGIERRAIAWWDRAFADTLREAAVRAGCPGFIYGYRGRESRARRLNIHQRGMDYLRSDGMGSCLPLAHWRAEDVWALLVSESLPWPHIYDVAKDRERMRSDFTWTVNMFQWGQEGEWRRAYPRLFDSWIERWPELKATTS